MPSGIHVNPSQATVDTWSHMRKRGMSCLAIGRQFGVAKRTIEYWMQKRGLEKAREEAKLYAGEIAAAPVLEPIAKRPVWQPCAEYMRLYGLCVAYRERYPSLYE